MLDTIYSNPWLTAVCINTILLIVAWILPKKLLTTWGYLNAWILGVIVWGTLGWQGYGVVMFYFLMGSGVTKIGMAEKEAAGIAEARSGRRGPENVWGAALTAAICALGTLLVNPEFKFLLVLAYVASFATKLSDTAASEVGKAYGKRTFLITTFKPVPAGTEGAVSLEGTVAGMVAAILISFLSYSLDMIDGLGIIWCIIAAFVATNIESLIGATWQTNTPWLTNEIVNFMNTAIGAIFALGCAWVAVSFV